jgi:hypothetical protein
MGENGPEGRPVGGDRGYCCRRHVKTRQKGPTSTCSDALTAMPRSSSQGASPGPPHRGGPGAIQGQLPAKRIGAAFGNSNGGASSLGQSGLSRHLPDVRENTGNYIDRCQNFALADDNNSSISMICRDFPRTRMARLNVMRPATAQNFGTLGIE